MGKIYFWSLKFITKLIWFLHVFFLTHNTLINLPIIDTLNSLRGLNVLEIRVKLEKPWRNISGCISVSMGKMHG